MPRYDYTADVAGDVRDVTLAPVPTDEHVAQLTVQEQPLAAGGTSAPVRLGEPGSSTVILTRVTAQDGNTTRLYTLRVRRGQAARDALLASMALEFENGTAAQLTPEFDGAATFNYAAQAGPVRRP